MPWKAITGAQCSLGMKDRIRPAMLRSRRQARTKPAEISNSQNVDVTVNATGLTAGTYRCNLIIASNDPDENPVVVPIILVVTSGPPPVNFGIVANVFDNNIHIINVDNNTIIGPLLSGNVGSGFLLDPVITPDGQKALISSFTEQKVYFIDIATPYNISVGGFVNIGFAAEDIALTPDGAFALVTDGGGSSQVAVIDVSAQSLIQTLPIAPRYAQAVSIAPDGTVLLADYVNNQLHFLTINLTTGLLTDLATAIPVDLGPLNIAIGRDGQTVLDGIDWLKRFNRPGHTRPRPAEDCLNVHQGF